MALKGHGDPRWIVQERTDGKNVNNWHWTETDFSDWAKNKLKELLSGVPLENDFISGSTSDVTTTGDVSINTRKGKTILFYELHCTVKWEVSLKSSGHTSKGTIVMPYISEENDDTDFEVQLTVEGHDTDDDVIKGHVRTFVIPVLKTLIPKMLSELREVALGKTNLQLKQTPSQKLDKLETMPVPTPVNPPTPSPVATAVPTPAKTTATTTVVQKSGKRVVTIKLTEKFMCRDMDLFQCFVEQNRVRAYAGSDANIAAEKGSKFSMFGGAVQGEITDVVPGKKIVQKWRFNSWPSDHFSTVTLDFEEKNGKTTLKLEQTGVPEDDKERTETGWNENFFKRIKGIFGFGSLY